MGVTSYKAWFKFKNDKPASNALVFATREEADHYAHDLLMRWYIPTGYEIRESDEEPNYEIKDNMLVRHGD